MKKPITARGNSLQLKLVCAQSVTREDTDEMLLVGDALGQGRLVPAQTASGVLLKASGLARWFYLSCKGPVTSSLKLVLL